MKPRFVCLTFLVFLLLAWDSTLGATDDWYEEESEEENHISEENPNEILTEDVPEFEKPDLICETNKMCKCIRAMKDTKEVNVVDCSHATLKGVALDTAHLSIRQVKDNADFKAEDVKLGGNNIVVLRKGMIMPEQEANILALDFSYNRIEMLEQKSFDSFSKLLKLKLTHNRLRNDEISDDWLTKKLGNTLHQLYLDYNYITQLDNKIFDNLSNLTKLVLDGNRGLRLTSQTFGPGLKQLRTLSLDNCGLKTLENDVFASLPKLAYLSLSGNNFLTVPQALSKVPKLSILAMSDTQLQSLGKHSFKSNLELRNVYMRKMPQLRSVEACAFCGLQTLEVVDFTGSKALSEINEQAFGQFSRKEAATENLNTLLLANCNLTSVSEGLLEWDNLKQFSLSGNPLVCDCTKMKWLLGNKNIPFHKDKPTCSAPEKVKDQLLKEAKACGNLETTSNQKMTLVVVLVGLCASVFVVGFFYARSKGGVRHFLPAGRPDSPQLGYSNLPRGHANDMDDGDRLEEDFNRPEFV